jgi:hypothetical protein
MRTNPRRATALLLVLSLGMAGCSSSPAPTAVGLGYVDPAGSGWRFLKDVERSTPDRLVLQLFGPQGARSRGVAFNLVAPVGLAFAAFADGLPIEDTGVYELLSRDLDPNEPVALAGGVKPGNMLTAGIFQKDRTWRAKDSGVALCRIALVVDPASPTPSGRKLKLQVKRAAIIPEDIGAVTDDAWTLDPKLKLTDVTVDVGAVTTR